ncbi:MAG: chondroitinase-B domain-containing protein [Tepidisphaeraceae bacterium]
MSPHRVVVRRFARFALAAVIAAFVPSPLARADEIGVSSAAEIQKAIAAAKPGDVIVLTDGEYKDLVIKFSAKGTKAEPIELRAQTPGGAKLLGNSSILFEGDHLVASGLFFGESTSTEPAVAFVGNDNRFTNSAIVAPDRGGKWIHFQKGQRNRLDHCYIEGHKPKEPTLQVELDETIPNEARIDHNHFGPRPPLGANGGETMRIGYSFQQNRVSKTVVEHNLFDRCDGEVEIISSKSTDSVFRYNTFRHCEGTLTLRHGGRATVDGNFFLGAPHGKSGGIRVIGAGHVIVNNYLENCAPTAGGVIALTSAMREPKPVDYQHVNGALVAFNTIVNCGLPYVRTDAGYAPDRTRDVLPKDVIVANNVFLAGGSSPAKSEGKALVEGREGTGFKWLGNIAHGAEVGSESAAKGIKVIDPKLSPGEDKVARPAKDSPVRGAAEGDFPNVKGDLDAQPRDGKKDVGADQVSDAKAGNRPLQPEDVGPTWMKAPRGTSTLTAARVAKGETEKTVRTLSHALQAEPAMLKNDHLTARMDNGRLIIEAGRGGAKVVATLADEVTRGGEPAVRAAKVADAYGESDAIEVVGKDATQQVWLPKGQPFALTRVRLSNNGAAPLKMKDLSVVTFTVEGGASGESAKLFGSDGPVSAAEGKTSYVFLSLADAKTRAGMVSGWLTHEKGSGIVEAAKPPFETKPQGPGQAAEGLKFDARSEFGHLTIAPGKTQESETFAIGFFDDVRDGLEAFADVTAKLNDIKLPPVPNGYSTWYHAKALDQERMARLAKFARENRLNEYGLNFLQIDDQWQVHRRDFVTHKTGEKATYPDGMKKTAEAINASGFTAGLWITPFGWQGQDKQDDKVVPNQTSLKDKPDYFVKRADDGSIYQVRWAGDCLDMSNPKARQFLAETIGRMTNDWGYKLLKIDGLWAGMAVKILYPSPTYRDDGLGDAVFYDNTKTNAEVYRDGLKLVRETAGPDTFLLGCNIAQNMRTMGGSVGLVDAMRVGPDIGATWEKVVRCAIPATWLYFWNGRVWWNDPDCLMLRDPLTLENGRAWASWIALSGQMNLVSEWLPDLPPERLDVYKRTIPNHNRRAARPVDLLEGKLARVWHLSYDVGDGRQDVVALFNWNAPAKGATTKPANGAVQEEPTASESATVGAGPANITLDLKDVGLDASQTYLAFDYWGNQFLEPIVGGKASLKLQPGTCKVIALKRQLDRPQLIGTNRHVSQGAVDLSGVKWNGATQTLSGTSRVVGGDDYELRLSTGSAAGRLSTATVSSAGDGKGVAVTSKQDGQHVRVTITSEATRDVVWEIRFASESASARGQ